MKLSSTASTINKIANLGSTENISRKVFLYQKCNCKIIAIEKYSSTYDLLVLEGDADSTSNGLLANGDTVILNSKSFNASNEITLDNQPSYSSTNKVTTVRILSSKNLNKNDIGFFLCKKIDVTEKIKDKSFNNVVGTIEDGVGSFGSMELNISFDNIDGYFYDRKNKSGLFFNNTHFTKIKNINFESSYAIKYGIYTTILEFDSINSDFSETDYVGKLITINSGNGIGERALISSHQNDNYFEVIGYFSENNYDPANYQTDLNIGDEIILSYDSEYFFRVEVGLLSEPTERVNIISGKLDFSTLKFENFDTVVTISGYSAERNLSEKIVSDVKFESDARKLTNITEMNMAHYIPSFGGSESNSLRSIKRIFNTDNVFFNIDFCSYDLEPGWHIIDVIPVQNLYRFDCGDWYRIRDKGDLEYSTESAFLSGPGGVIPDHSSKEGSDEKKAHYYWAQISFNSSDNSSGGISALNYSGVSSPFSPQFEKIVNSGMIPTRFFFKLSEGSGINRKVEVIGRFGYEFNGGSVVFPEMYPQYFLAGSSFSTLEKQEVLSGESVFAGNNFVVGSFDKFNGLEISFSNYNVGSLVSNILSHIKLQYSTGGDILDSSNWSKNVFSRYCGAMVDTVTSQTVLKCVIKNWDEAGTGGAGNMDDDEINNMYLKSINGSNAGEVRKILDFGIDGSDYGDITIEKEFTNNVSVDDQFEVINKNIDIKIKDFGDALHSGEYWDCAIAHSIGNITTETGLEHDRRDHFYEELATISDNDLFGNVFYLGKYGKFDSICLTSYLFGKFVSPNGSFLIEYWNGIEWVPVENFNSIGYEIDSFSNIGYVFTYDCLNWAKRTGTELNSSAFNNDAELYYIRIRCNPLTNISLYNIRVFTPSKLNAVITWNNFDGWGKGLYNDSCIDYGTLTELQQDIPLFFVSIQLDDSGGSNSKYLNKIQTINKLTGHGSDNLYVSCDLASAKETDEEDFVYINKNKINNVDVVPKIATDKFLIDRVALASGSGVNNLIVKNYIKNLLSNDRNFNIIGNFDDIVSVVPVRLNWDTAQYFYEQSSTISLSGSPTNLRWCSIVKTKGRFEMYVLRDDSGYYVEKYTSDDGVSNWSKDGSTFSASGNYADLINSISVVVNYENDNAIYHLFLVGQTTGNPLQVYHVSWTTWGSFTDENSGNAVLTVGSGGSWDETNIIDAFVIYGKEDAFDYYELWYTAENSSSTKAIGYANSTDGTSFTKDTNNPILQKGTGGDFDDTNIFSPTVFKVYNNNSVRFALIYYIGEDSGGNRALGLAYQVANSSSSRATEKHSGSLLDLSSSLRCLYVCQEFIERYSFRYSYDFIKIYMSDYSDISDIHLSDGVNLKQDYLVKEYRDEFSESDKFITDSVSLSFSSSDGTMILGSRFKFDFVDVWPSNETNEDLTIEYWNGSDWADLEVEQFGVKASTIKNKIGFFFDPPNDWKEVSSGYLVDNLKINGSNSYLKRNSQALYFLRIKSSSSSGVNVNKFILLKGGYLIADKYNVWYIGDDGFLEHKFCSSKLHLDGNGRFEIENIFFNSVTEEIYIVCKHSKFFANNIAQNISKFYVYKSCLFGGVSSLAPYGTQNVFKDSKYIYREGSEITNDNSKKIMVYGRHSDDYVDNLGA